MVSMLQTLFSLPVTKINKICPSAPLEGIGKMEWQNAISVLSLTPRILFCCMPFSTGPIYCQKSFGRSPSGMPATFIAHLITRSQNKYRMRTLQASRLHGGFKIFVFLAAQRLYWTNDFRMVTAYQNGALGAGQGFMSGTLFIMLVLYR